MKLDARALWTAALAGIIDSSNLKRPRDTGQGSRVIFVPPATGSKRKLPFGVAGPAASPSKAIFFVCVVFRDFKLRRRRLARQFEFTLICGTHASRCRS